MIAEGVDPKIFNTENSDHFAHEFRIGVEVKSDRTTVAWQIITQFAGQGFAIFAEVRGITNAQIDDCLEMLRAQRDKLPELERELGWAD
jgi:hypothetical protein